MGILAFYYKKKKPKLCSKPSSLVYHGTFKVLLKVLSALTLMMGYKSWIPSGNHDNGAAHLMYRAIKYMNSHWLLDNFHLKQPRQQTHESHVMSLVMLL